ncbi:glycosyltransferase family 39 protein [Candidatus Woesearchaeota archaeon]|nr:glycosyltransferase family 39 protein [Candidatus Woesearchaeota archaeon]
MEWRRVNSLFVCFALILFSAVFISASAAVKTAPTWDEPTYIAGGYYYLKTGDPRMVTGLPLNTMILAGAPLIFNNPPLPPDAGSYVDISYVKFGHYFLFGQEIDVEKAVFLSRIPFIIVFILLGIFVFFWARELYGKRAALLAFFLYSFSATVLAYSFIVCADLLLAAFGFISIFFFWSFVKKRKLRWLFLSSVFFALSLNTKLNALFLIPIFVCLFAALLLKKVRPEASWKKLRLFNKESFPCYLKSFFIIALIFGAVTFVIIFSAYGFQFAPLEDGVPQSYTERGLEVVSGTPVEGFATKMIGVPVPFPTYLGGFFVHGFVSSHSVKKSYLFGETYSGGKWYYFPVEMLIKVQIPLMLLLLIVIFFFRKVKSDWLSESFLIIPPLIYLLLFLPNTVNSDIRHLLFIFPFLFVFVSKIVKVRLKETARKALSALMIVLVVWYALSTVLIYPHFLSYFNEFVGPDNGHKYLVGGNLDWGQDINSLADYLHSNNIEKVSLSYFGSADPSYYGIEYDYLPSPVWQPWVPDYAPFESGSFSYSSNCSERSGYVAVSLTNLHGVYLLNETCYSWLFPEEPSARIGHSIWVYNLTG